MANSFDRKKILFITQFSLLFAIEILFCFTPLGSIPIGPIVATLAMIPVIITAILLGTAAGAAMGFFAGLCSFIVFSFITPGPTAFIFTPLVAPGNFWSLVICFLPRVLVGVVTGLLCRFFRSRKSHFWSNPTFAYGVSGMIGSLTNTFLVLGGTWLFFGKEYALAIDQPYTLLLSLIGGVILTNGIPEAIVSFLAAIGICTPLKRALKRNGF